MRYPVIEPRFLVTKMVQINWKEVYWQNPENLFFRGGHFWRAKSKKMAKIFLKNFIVPKRSFQNDS